METISHIFEIIEFTAFKLFLLFSFLIGLWWACRYEWKHLGRRKTRPRLSRQQGGR
jgi:hypothetical protein